MNVLPSPTSDYYINPLHLYLKRVTRVCNYIIHVIIIIKRRTVQRVITLDPRLVVFEILGRYPMGKSAFSVEN